MPQTTLMYSTVSERIFVLYQAILNRNYHNCVPRSTLIFIVHTERVHKVISYLYIPTQAGRYIRLWDENLLTLGNTYFMHMIQGI